MTIKFCALILCCVVAASRASSLQEYAREFVAMPDRPDGPAERGIPHPQKMNRKLNKSLRVAGDAFSEVVNEFEGFLDQDDVFVQKSTRLVYRFVHDYLRAYLPLLKAAPADVLKEMLINISKAFAGLVGDFGPLLKDYNPLHPRKSDDLRTLIRRQISTISTFGGALEHLFDALDKVVVNYVDALAENLVAAEGRIKEAIVKLEETPAEDVKKMAIQFIKHWIQSTFLDLGTF